MPKSDPFPNRTLAEDLLDGAEDFANFLGWPVRRVFYLLEKGLIPARKTGNRWTGLKSRVRQHFEAVEDENDAVAVADRFDPAADSPGKLNRKSRTR
jgi:hypothetical protein